MRAGQRSRLRRPPRVSLHRRLLVAAAALLWIALVLYPNPLSFFGSLWRLADPPVEPGVVNSLVDKLPDDYPAVETFSREYVQYDNPWTLYGEPWHFPTLGEVLADGAGDCQAEALLTASLLEAKGMPYILRYSFNHVWVDYPGKMVSSLEDPATAFVSEADAGWFARLPQRVPLRNIVETRLAFHWTPMPAGRKALLFLGLVSLMSFMEWPVLSRLSVRVRLAGRFFRGRARDRPLILSHLLTTRCNARCATCLWRNTTETELSSEEVARLYREAGSARIAQLVVWGGEPLLREDLPALLAVARQSGMATAMITNGWGIAERWPALRGNVDGLLLSLDDVGDAHDRMRGIPGLYRSLEEFVPSLEGDPLRPRLIMNTTLSRLNKGALSRVAPVARRWGAGLYTCPMETGEPMAGGFADTKGDLALSPEELRHAAFEALRLKRAGYPLLSSNAYFRLLAADPALKSYRCRAPRALLTVGADGAIRDCLRRDVPLAYTQELHARGGRLEDVFALARYRQMLAEAESCTACNNPDAIEMSWFWNLRPVLLERALRIIAG